MISPPSPLPPPPPAAAGPRLLIAGPVTSPGVNTTATPAYGQAPTAGNLLVCFCTDSFSGTNPTTPAGWTQATQGSSNNNTATIYFKVAAGGDASPSFPNVAGVRWTAQVAEFAGTPVNSPASFAGNSINQTNSATISATCGGTDAAGSALVVGVGLCGFFNGAALSETPTMNNGGAPQEMGFLGQTAVSTWAFATAWGVTATSAPSAADSMTFTFASNAAGNNTFSTVCVASFK